MKSKHTTKNLVFFFCLYEQMGKNIEQVRKFFCSVINLKIVCQMIN